VQASFEFRHLRCFASPSDGTFLPKETDLSRDHGRRGLETDISVRDWQVTLLRHHAPD
jgi:hypothetical protein